ncbi:hypothetical protein BV898_06622 [Hypsibius exemplaris]|uniref:Transmembrane inner ear expressed protein n=1 Tax=Hypsibius exemplaris TaxID=2072580 RepID=A0A1W0WW06_HYPEX|nr:hypothetical protein BV898_06622 [Hypsibius exemplaris]
MAATTTTRSILQELQAVQAGSPVLGMQLWHLVAIILLGICVLLSVVCCFIDWRIPRTRKEIDLDRQLRVMADKYAEEMIDKMKEEEEQDDDAVVRKPYREEPRTPVFKV